VSKKNLLTLLLLLLVTNYASFQAGQTVRYYNPSPQQAGSPASAPTRPPQYGVNQLLWYNPSRVDFGRIETPTSGSAAPQRWVRVENRGAEAVTVAAVRSENPSVTVELVGERTLPPGGQAQLRMTVDPATAPAEFSVGISVEYQGAPQVDRLLATGQLLK
jgi:hypothetical protein